jgi:A/G-specific adenine glycosylase
MSVASGTSAPTEGLLAWYDRVRRDLPWRAAPGSAGGTLIDPYHVLVSELMLQQTQVATVVPYFRRFMEAFPTIEALAGAEEQAVLRLWQGLGYYSRARNLQKAAQAVVAAGRFPDTLEGIQALPGVGPYTAGAIGSIAFNLRVPLVDGNVTRVLARLDGMEGDPRTPAAVKQIWRRAEGLVPADRPGDFNSALMELGATVCTPKKPSCLLCPLQGKCVAREKGLTEAIPPAKQAKPTPAVVCKSYAIVDRGGRWLIEQRPDKGRWASLWQLPTVDPEMPGHQVRIPKGIELRKAGVIRHQLTHRAYTFELWLATGVQRDAVKTPVGRSAWVDRKSMANYPLAKPQLEMVKILENLGVIRR